MSRTLQRHPFRRGERRPVSFPRFVVFGLLAIVALSLLMPSDGTGRAQETGAMLDATPEATVDAEPTVDGDDDDRDGMVSATVVFPIEETPKPCQTDFVFTTQDITFRNNKPVLEEGQTYVVANLGRDVDARSIRVNPDPAKSGLGGDQFKGITLRGSISYMTKFDGKSFAISVSGNLDPYKNGGNVGEILFSAKGTSAQAGDTLQGNWSADTRISNGTGGKLVISVPIRDQNTWAIEVKGTLFGFC
jgi:hypothetical protein